MEIGEMLAKVLAAENISVEQHKVRTASFNLATRTLTLPTWENMSRCVELMLIEHEVGHALYTPADGYSAFCAQYPALRSAINVLEDARVDRLMRERYPGTRKDYAEAMAQFRTEDFFELAGHNLQGMGIVDRINIFFKLGAASKVQFSRQEQPLVVRAQHLVTFDEVKQLALDLLELVQSAQAPKENKTDSGKQDSESADEQDTDSADELGNDSEQDSDSADEQDSDSEQASEQDSEIDDPWGVAEPNAPESSALDSLTDQLQQSKLADAAHVEGHTPSYVTIPEDYKDPTSYIVGHKTIIEMGQARKYESDDPELSRKFAREVMPQVLHMVQTFESKKSASLYALRAVRKTGILDGNKISQYKVKQDLFLRNVQVPEGKNHGMVMLLDWSGSMRRGDIITSSLQQVIQLALFCRRAALPFRVYAFSSDDAYPGVDTSAGVHHQFRLLELFSDKMSESDTNEMMALLLGGAAMRAFPLRGTPLAPALAYMRKLLPAFRAQYAIQKLNLITFTDGINTESLAYGAPGSHLYIKDPVTKKNYPIFRSRSDHRVGLIDEINVFYRILQDRCNCVITSYFVHASGKPLANALFTSGVYNSPHALADSRAKEYSKAGFLKITGYGRNASYIVRSATLGGSPTSVSSNLVPGLSAAKIAAEICSGARAGAKSKMLAQNFVESLS